jgi:multidrug efflux pump subunit AcrB
MVEYRNVYNAFDAPVLRAWTCWSSRGDALGGIGAFLLFPLIGGGFLPPMDQSQFTVAFETPEGSSLAYTRGKAEQIGETIREIPGVEYTYTTVGAGRPAP